MTEQGLWVRRKTGIKVGHLGWKPRQFIVFLGLFHNERVNTVAIKIHRTCLLHLLP